MERNTGIINYTKNMNKNVCNDCGCVRLEPGPKYICEDCGSSNIGRNESI